MLLWVLAGRNPISMMLQRDAAGQKKTEIWTCVRDVLHVQSRLHRICFAALSVHLYDARSLSLHLSA